MSEVSEVMKLVDEFAMARAACAVDTALDHKPEPCKRGCDEKRRAVVAVLEGWERIDGWVTAERLHPGEGCLMTFDSRPGTYALEQGAPEATLIIYRHPTDSEGDSKEVTP